MQRKFVSRKLAEILLKYSNFFLLLLITYQDFFLLLLIT